jgi:hypothetical protein
MTCAVFYAEAEWPVAEFAMLTPVSVQSPADVCLSAVVHRRCHAGPATQKSSATWTLDVPDGDKFLHVDGL